MWLINSANLIFQVHAIDSTNLTFPVSVWVKKLDTVQPRCLVVMEAVEQTTGWAQLNSEVRDVEHFLINLAIKYFERDY
jgi:hypothetical protein